MASSAGACSPMSAKDTPPPRALSRWRLLGHESGVGMVRERVISFVVNLSDARVLKCHDHDRGT